MSTTTQLPGGTWTLGDVTVARFGYGAMQLAGPGVTGMPEDHDGALAVLREAVELGITHIDTSESYGPGVTNELIREALHPYGDSVHIVTKIGGTRDAQGGWPTARTPEDLRQQVQDNLRSLGLDSLGVVYLRLGNAEGPVQEPTADSFRAMVDMQHEGLIRHIGISNATPDQVREARSIAPIVCVQNMYNLAVRQDDDLIDELASDGVAYVPFFPLGGFAPLQYSALSAVADRLETNPRSVALSWLLQRSPNILLIPGTTSVAHLRENIAGAGVQLSEADLAELDTIGR